MAEDKKYWRKKFNKEPDQRDIDYKRKKKERDRERKQRRLTKRKDHFLDE